MELQRVTRYRWCLLFTLQQSQDYSFSHNMHYSNNNKTNSLQFITDLLTGAVREIVR